MPLDKWKVHWNYAYNPFKLGKWDLRFTVFFPKVREVVKQAKNEQAMFKRNTILFMDEVHRFNKAQQDTFLPHIESGNQDRRQFPIHYDTLESFLWSSMN